MSLVYFFILKILINSRLTVIILILYHFYEKMFLQQIGREIARNKIGSCQFRGAPFYFMSSYELRLVFSSAN